MAKKLETNILNRTKLNPKSTTTDKKNRVKDNKLNESSNCLKNRKKSQFK